MAVPFTIPGERVRARLGAARGDTLSADLIEVLEPSPHRVTARCPHFGPQARGGQVCGGCSWQHIAYDEQLRLKADLVTRLLRRAVPGAPPARPMLAPTGKGSPWGYRQKVHFVVGTSGRSTLVMGHYARLSRRLVPVVECPVHDERGNAAASALYEACRAAGVRSVKGIAIRVGANTSEVMATLIVGDETDRGVRDAVRRAQGGSTAPTSLHVNVHPRDSAYVFGPRTRHVAGPGRLREDLGGVPFLISPTSFFQTNVRAAEALVDLVLAAVPAGATVLDLYAGAGLFALPLARRGHRVVAVEENRTAVADGLASMALTRLPEEACRFVPRPVESAGRIIGQTLPSPDVVVLDPPREGCHPDVLARTFSPGVIPLAIYVSCNPESLARDLASVVRWGYRIESVQPVDMFPHTPHVETVVTLRQQR